MACNTCGTNPCGCKDVRLPRGPRGYQGEPGPALEVSEVNVTTLAPGSDATGSASQSGQFLIMNFGIPAGATGPEGPSGGDGADGQTFATTLTSFNAPALNVTSPATVGDTSWMQVGQWLFIEGGGYFYVTAVNSPTSVQLLNAGSVAGWPSGVPGNLISSAVAATGSGIQVQLASPPGIPGEEGPAGPEPELPDTIIETVTTPPVGAPAPGEELKIYVDNLVTPTTTLFYSWNGATWDASPELIGPDGTKIIPTAGDPNSTLPGGLNIGDFALNTVAPGLWLKTGASTYVLQVSLVNTFSQVATASAGDMGTTPVSTQAIVGFVTNADTHNAPGTYTFDLQYQSTYVDADKDIDLDWTDGAYNKDGRWLFLVQNNDAAPINVTYAAGRWAKDSGITEPPSINAGRTQAFECYKYNGRMVIAHTYLVVSI